MLDIDEPIPISRTVHSIEEAKEAVKFIGKYPVLIRPAYTLGGTGGGIAYNEEELVPIVGRGLIYSRIRQVLIEESVIGWKEFEYEVMRDRNDNCIIICSMENFDAMGIHTGESIVVAPVQTLNDVDHQRLRTAAIKIIRALGIEGGCNIQFAFDPTTKEYRVIEVNPRVSRSSALASKATGYPIARVAAKIAVGKTLDEIVNKITGKTAAAFEPTIDYVVVKIPRWPFDKFRTVDKRLGTQMKSTGEVMAIGRTIEEGIMKAIRSLEIDRIDLEAEKWSDEIIEQELKVATDKRLFIMAEAIRRGMPLAQIAAWSQWDEFFVRKVRNLVEMERELKGTASDRRAICARPRGWDTRTRASPTSPSAPRPRSSSSASSTTSCPPTRWWTPAPPSSRRPRPTSIPLTRPHCEARRSHRRKVVIVGAGPIRIGQGIEFDYCCVHGVMACQEENVDAIVINNNPETVSTDYDISDRLYFEPLTLEDVVNVIEREDADGAIVQFGGQTSVNLAVPLEEALKGKKAKILGTLPDMIDMAEDRKRWTQLMNELGIKQPESGHGPLLRRDQGRGGPHRFPSAASALLRIGRPGHGDHLQRGGDEDLRGDGGAGVQEAPRAHRQVPLPRHRDRCGRGRGRRGRLHRRHNGAHRGGGGALRRRHHDPARADTAHLRHGPHRGDHRAGGQGLADKGPDEPAAGREGR